ALAPGKTVRVEATVWAYGGVSSGKPDPYYPAHAHAPARAVIAPPPPAAAGGRGGPPPPPPPPRGAPARGGRTPVRGRAAARRAGVRRHRRLGVPAAVPPARRPD